MQALVGRQSGRQVQWRFRDVFVSLIEAELVALKVPRAQQSSLARFLAGGLSELLMHWLEHPQGLAAEKLAIELRRLALGMVALARER